MTKNIIDSQPKSPGVWIEKLGLGFLYPGIVQTHCPQLTVVSPIGRQNNMEVACAQKERRGMAERMGASAAQIFGDSQFKHGKEQGDRKGEMALSVNAELLSHGHKVEKSSLQSRSRT